MENNEVFYEIFVGLTLLSMAIYSFYVAISFLRGKNLKNTNLYKIGEIISKIIQDKDKIEKIASDLENPEDLKKKGFLFLFFSIVCFILTLVVLFG